MEFDYELVCRYSVKITGRRNLDLVHHCISICDLSNVVAKENYLYGVMRRQYQDPRSAYNKLYKSFSELKETSLEIHEPEHFELTEADLQKVVEFKKKFPLEFEVFEETVNSSVRQVAKKTRIGRRTIERICTFVKTEIKNGGI